MNSGNCGRTSKPSNLRNSLGNSSKAFKLQAEHPKQTRDPFENGAFEGLAKPSNERLKTKPKLRQLHSLSTDTANPARIFRVGQDERFGNAPFS